MLKEKSWSLEEEAKLAMQLAHKGYKLDQKKKIYSIDTPPPYVNVSIHIGHAVTYTYMDFFARFKRMQGFSVLFPLGLDRNGLPIELAAERKFNVRAEDIGREKFLEYCRKVLEEASDISVKTFARLGISFNTYKFGTKIGEAYLTDSNDYRKLTQETFLELWQKGLIYEDRKVSNYCPGCKTTVADAEIIYEEKHTELYHIKFKVEQGKDIIIATTRPELLCSCAVVLFNPDDKRYKSLEGKHAITPLYEKEVKIKAHPLAKQEFGSGLVMMCSFGDLTDIRFFREDKIKPIIAIDEHGKMNANAGFLKSLSVHNARKEIIKKLEVKGLVVKKEKILQRAPICERSKDPIEFIFLPEYYLKQVEFKKKILELQKKIKFYDEASRQILIDWINSISEDWPLSRRRYYATPIPLWTCKKCGEKVIGKKGKYWQPWKEKPQEKCKCGGTLEGETRVFDTWFDSSISELYILGYKRHEDFFRKAYPCTLRPQGKEIVRTWLYYTILRSYQLTGKPCFENAWINFHILDEKGRKMSKSLGNVIDPQDIIKKYGSESLRLWTATDGNLTRQDFHCSEEKISAELKTLIKLWNVAKFASSFKQGEKGKKLKLREIDKLFINYMNELVLLAEKSYEKYDFHMPAIKLRSFIWEIFSSHYIELVKARAYKQAFSKEEQEAAIYTLHYCLQKILLLLAPIIPVATYKIYKEMFGKDIHGEKFPRAEKKHVVKAKINDLIKLNSLIWKEKKSRNLSLKAEIKSLELSKEFDSLKSLVEDLRVTHNIRELKFEKGKVKFEF